jgi:23S rRNA (pseudouridine1915-N3)-methyltransferase
MKISLICMGKTSFPFLREGIELYNKRMDRYLPFEIIEIPDKKQTGTDQASVLKKESELLLAKFHPSDFVVLLDERGDLLNSGEMAKFIESRINLSIKHLVFVIGGAYGFSENVYARANAKLSLSKMTFSHQLVRLIFMEQLYRAFTIIKGEPYHHS